MDQETHEVSNNCTTTSIGINNAHRLVVGTKIEQLIYTTLVGKIQMLCTVNGSTIPTSVCLLSTFKKQFTEKYEELVLNKIIQENKIRLVKELGDTFLSKCLIFTLSYK